MELGDLRVCACVVCVVWLESGRVDRVGVRKRKGKGEAHGKKAREAEHRYQ